MRKQLAKDTFQKKANTYLYDNKDDEIVMNILQLYPERESFFFMGSDGEKKRKHMQAKLRKILNEMQGEEVYANALGDRLRNFGRRAKERLRDVGQVLARAALVVPRGAALALIRLNFRGSAKRLSLLTDKAREEVNNRWKKIGGKTDRLNDAINAGKDKPIVVCGKKCRAKAGRNPRISDSVKDDFVNAVDPASVTALVSAGGTVLGGLLAIAGNNKAYKNQQELAKLESELKQKDAAEASIDATMTAQEKAIAEQIIAAQNLNNDPARAIASNPNLTALEKQAALEELNKSQGVFSSNKKVIGGVLIILGIIGVAYYALSNKTSQA